MLDAVGKLWAELERSSKAVVTALDFGLALGRIPFGRGGLPMGCVAYRIENQKIHREDAEERIRQFWEGVPDEPLTWEQVDNTMSLTPKATNRMFARTRPGDLEREISAVIEQPDADLGETDGARNAESSSNKLEGGAVQEMALRIFKSFHVQAVLVLRPHLHALLHNTHDEKTICKALRRDKGLQDFKGRLLLQQKQAIESDIQRE